MARRRANGEGSIYPTKDGRWRSALTVGLKANGQPNRKYFTGRTQADVRAKLSHYRQAAGSGTVVDPSRETVEQHVSCWLEQHIQAHKSPSTHAQYEAAAALIYPRIGRILLQQLRPSNVQSFVDGMVNEGESSRMRQVAFDVLRRACGHAIKLRKIAADPTEPIARPSHQAKEIFPFDATEAARLIEESRGTRAHLAIVLGITMGMRIGEILGLERRSVDSAAGTLRIVQQVVETRAQVRIAKPKTKSSVRTIELTAMAVRAFDEHAAIMMREGNAAHALVLPSIEGGLERRTNFSRRCWKKLLIQLGLTERGFHHARHTYATLALTAGVPVHIVSSVMGHNKPSTTHDIYAHLLKGQASQSTAAFNRLFDAG